MHTEIVDAKKLVEDLKFGLQYYKDEEKQLKQKARINTVIKLVNLCERLSNNSEDRDVMGVMVLQMLKAKYDAVNVDGSDDGFISQVWYKAAAMSIGFDLRIGYQEFKKQLAAQFAGDMLNNAKFLTEDEKCGNVHENPKVAKLFGDTNKMWEENIDTFVKMVHHRRTENYLNGVN